MDFSNPIIDAQAQRQELAERIDRAAAAKIPASTHRHLLAQRLHRFAERIDT